MARLPSIKRIVAEDFPSEVQKWVGKLLQPLNSFFESTHAALGKGLTVADNFDGMLKTVEVSGFPTKFKWERRSPPKALWVVQCRESQGVHTNFTSAPYADWEFTQDGQVSILALTGLSPTASNKYQVTVIVMAG